MEENKTPIRNNPNTWTYYNDPEKRAKIDAHLETMTSLEAQKGIDSTPNEKKLINVELNRNLVKIKELDCFFWERLCPTKDEEVVK